MTSEVSPSRGALADFSAAITAGATAETAIAANPARRYFLFQNISDTNMWVNFGATAVADKPSIKIVPDAALIFESGFVPVGLVSVICATTGKKYVCKEAA